MFLGHFGVALAAKRHAPRASLGTAILAAQLVDLAWSAAFGAAYAAARRLYAKAARPRDRIGRGAFAGLVAFLGAIYAANLFGPPPPSAQAIGAAGLAMGLLVAWGYWIDRHRTVPGATP